MLLNPDVRSHLMNLIDLHDIQSRGLDGDDNEYADDLRDEMDVTWYRMSERENDVVGHVSALLNSLERKNWVVTLTIETGKEEKDGTES